MTTEEKKRINSERQMAVRKAWKREKELVQQGMGTVNWTEQQQKELLERGAVKGYEGQHMKSVSKFPEFAGSVDNIQLLSHEEHLEAHNSGIKKSGYRSPTNGYYDPQTKIMNDFGDRAPSPPKPMRLKNVYRARNDRYLARHERSQSSSLQNSQRRRFYSWIRRGGRIP